VSAVYREARSLALISNSQALAEYYGQAILRRLETEFPSAILRRFFPADTDVIVQAFNKVVARIPLEEARAAPSPQQSMEVWVVHDAAALLVGQVQTMLNLIEKFPGANVRALLIFSGVQVAPEGLDAFEKSLMRWQVDRPTLEQIKESMSNISDPRRLVEVRDLAARIAGNGNAAIDAENDVLGTSSTVAKPALRSRSGSAGNPPATEHRHPQPSARVKLAGAAALLLAFSGGIASWLNPEAVESWRLALYRQEPADSPADAAVPPALTVATSEAPKDIAPAEAIKEVAGDLVAPTQEKASAPSGDHPPREQSPGDKPQTEAALIAEAQRRAAQFKLGTYVVQHAYHTSFGLAVEHHKRYPNLSVASVIPQYEQDRKSPRFALISGPFESKAAAEAFIRTQNMPKGSWVRMSSGIQERLEPRLD